MIRLGFVDGARNHVIRRLVINVSSTATALMYWLVER